jgi:peroxiredoxin
MRQLVELNKNAKKFEEAGVDVIAIFREEAKGVEGLAAIRKKTETKFTLALDNGKKQTPRFAPGKRDFSSYVVNRNGEITKIINGDLRNRAKSAELLQAVAKLGDAESSSKGSDKK